MRGAGGVGVKGDGRRSWIIKWKWSFGEDALCRYSHSSGISPRPTDLFPDPPLRSSQPETI